MSANALWKADAVYAATGGQGQGDWQALGVSIDSRTLNKGDLFVAIAGPHFDGHDFVPLAMKAGAAAAVVARAPDMDKRFLVLVPDTLKALEDLGRAARARSKAKIIAITGSVGKTGSKEALKHMLSAQMPTHASEGSLNNQWGVPLSLSRMAESVKAGVFEIGMNHAGEITPLVQMVRPHVALITTVEPVHLEFFPNVEAIAEAKAEIFSGLEKNGTAVLNADNRHFELLKKRAQAHGARILSFGANASADARLVSLDTLPEHSLVKAEIDGRMLSYELGIAGRHIALNSLGWLSAVGAIGADVALAASRLKDLQPTKGRGTRSEIRLSSGSVLLIDESYNANPASMRAALHTLASTKPSGNGRRIAVMGDMLELGEEARTLHAELAQAITDTKTDLIFLAGPLMGALAGALPHKCLGAHAMSAEELAPSVIHAIRPGDVVMVKGSYGSRMRAVVAALNASGAAAGQSE